MAELEREKIFVENQIKSRVNEKTDKSALTAKLRKVFYKILIMYSNFI